MKNKKRFRILVTVVALILVMSLTLTALASNVTGDVNGDGKITAFDAQMIAEKNAGRRSLTDEQAERAEGWSVKNIINYILNTKQEEPDPDAPPSNAIATVTNGDETRYVITVESMQSAVSSTGNTQIKLLKDITRDSEIALPYSCTIDFNGHTITTNLTSGNGLALNAKGSENQTWVIKNGTLVSFTIGLRVAAGAIVVENMNLQTLDGASVALYDTTNYKNINRISNSTLSSGNWGCVTYNLGNGNFSNTGITIEDSTLISHRAGGSNVFVKNSGVTPGLVTMGDNVKMYTYYTAMAASGYTFDGIAIQKAAATTSVKVGDMVYDNMNLWYTSSNIGTQTPTEDSIAKVVNGNQTKYASTVDDISALVQSSGNTQITLLKDLSINTALSLPYSCSLDLGGYTLSTNPNSGNGIEIAAAGSENKTTTVKNGKLIHYVVGIRVLAGAVIVEDMEVISLNGPCVAIYDGAATYKAINRISNTTLASPYTCVAFNAAEVDFRNTGVTVENSTLISHGDKSRVFLKNKPTGDCRTGNIHFGENVELYTYKETPASDAYTRYSGNVPNKAAAPATVTVNGTTYEGLNHWSSEIEFTGTNILAIGNSFCYRLVQEVYGMAATAGKDICITNLYEAGCYVQEHWEWLNNDTPNYEYWITNSMGRWMRTDITTIGAAIEYQDWDVITLQQHFDPARTTSGEVALNSCTPYAKNLFDYLKANCPDAELYWHETWAYQANHGSIGSVERQTTQYESILYASKAICQENDVPMIPCGDAWQLARAEVGDTLCLTDCYHDGDVGGGQYLNACVWYETIFGESCVGSTYDPSMNDIYTLDADFRATLQAVAHEAVAAIYGEDYVK